jgi:4-alpha-glucanotransferase
MPVTMGRREAGIVLPLFALRAEGDWGIGEIGTLPAFAAWLAEAQHRRLQILPIFEVPPGERSPYAALSSSALDPIYLAMGEVDDFVAAGGEAALDDEARDHLRMARAAPGIAYDDVRAAKRAAIAIAFEHFLTGPWASGSPRAHALRRFQASEAPWLDEHVLFRALKEGQAERSWDAWPGPLRDHDPAALASARAALERQCLLQSYVQWLVAEQWTRARRAANDAGVAVDGDLAFMVSSDSADVWARQREFDLDASLGAPPDAFNAGGQDWGLPVPRWEVMEGDGFAWLRARIRRAAALFDGCRLDHAVGYYRVYRRAAGGAGAFAPDAEASQRALGERLVRVVLEAADGAAIFAEDLGFVPPFVRASLSALGVPGMRVLRWEAEGGVFRDPRDYPSLSVATAGTHDLSTLRAWWEDECDAACRRALAAVPVFASLAQSDGSFNDEAHRAILEGLYAAGSDLVMLPFQDAYAGRERINVPATVGAANWGYRIPWTIEALRGAAGTALRDRLRALALRSGR